MIDCGFVLAETQIPLPCFVMAFAKRWFLLRLKRLIARLGAHLSSPLSHFNIVFLLSFLDLSCWVTMSLFYCYALDGKNSILVVSKRKEFRFLKAHCFNFYILHNLKFTQTIDLSTSQYREGNSLFLLWNVIWAFFPLSTAPCSNDLFNNLSPVWILSFRWIIYGFCFFFRT